MKKSIFGLTAVLLGLTFALSLVAPSAQAGLPTRVIAVDGVGNVGGQPALVHILAVVPPGDDAAQVARGALAAQGARPFTPADFSLTGSVDWNSYPGVDDSVTQYYNPAGEPANAGDWRAAYLAGQAAWTGVISSNLEVHDGGDTTRLPSLVRESPGRQVFDRNNDVAWMDLKDRNTLGVTWSGTSGGWPEADVAMNTDFSWADDGTSDYDAITVFIHEFGHVIGIGHSSVTGAIMEAIYDGVRRTLHADDIAAVSTLYPDPTAPMIASFAADDASVAPGASTTVRWATSNVASVSIDAFVTNGSADGSAPTPPLDATTMFTLTAYDGDGYTVVPGTVTVTVAVPGTTVSIASISYSTSGGRSGDRNLRIELSVIDDQESAVSGASVSIRLLNSTTGQQWTGTASTGDDGSVTFQLRNAPDGDYDTVVEDASAPDLTWDGVTPPNGFTKT